MKKLTQIIALFILINNQLYSQNFAPVGTKWRFNYAALGSASGSIDYEALNDTIIRGLSYRRVSYKKKCYPNDPRPCYPSTNDNDVLFFHQRNDSLFQLYTNWQTKLVFDFKANIGDTLDVINDLLGGAKTLPVVTRKSDTLIAGQTIKFWELRQTCISAFPIEVFTTRVYDKLYRMEDGLFIYGRCGGFIEYYASLCYFKDGNFRFDPSNCLRTSVNNLEQSASISIFPNPSFDKININSSINFKRFSIYNSSGQLIKNNIFLNQNEINISDLDKGFYLIQLIDNEEISVYKKFIKQ